LKQVVQNYNTGELRLEDVPVPMCRSGGALVRAAYSLVSSGTERMKVDQARMSLLQKARARPDKVKQVLASVKQVGLTETLSKVRERLDALTPLGYSLAGIVEEVGAGVDEIAPGDRVACAGEAIACHAEFVSVPRNLCVPVPDNVDLKDAAFTTVGAIAMNGVRQASVSLGDTVVVIGLGLVGLLGVQILKAAGCRVIGIDLDPHKIELARQCGADVAARRDDPALEDTIDFVTGGIGADAVYIAASTQSTDPMDLAGRITRDRGRVVIVGMVKVEADWQTYYHKELSVIMSRSYGPGRYDRNYELKGIDYPIGYVRWTERRNMEEFLRLLSTKQVRPTLLGPQVFPIQQAPEAYQQLHDSPGKHAVGILFEYPPGAPIERRVSVTHADSKTHPACLATSESVSIALIGAGNFTTATLIPALKRLGNVRLRSICSAGGLTARSAARRHGFEEAVSDYQQVLSDPQINAVVIATRHDTHARFAAEALRAGKHVFVEKPLALTRQQLEEVVSAEQASGRILVPGFNRRYSPMSVAVRDHFASRSSPIEVVCRVNAGEIKADSWYQDPEEGGWRIISEGCHFVDLIQFICGSPPVRVSAEMIGGHAPGGQNDNCIVSLRMQDGSIATLIYVANGDPQFEKERVEVFGQGRSAVIENFRRTLLYSGKGLARTLKGHGKGHAEEMAAFVQGIKTGQSPISLDESISSTLATLAAGEALQAAGPVMCGDASFVNSDSSRGNGSSS
jgi:predicted dehydrogenase/threonine dehydrogenase-like Zn-dependent dehydrogenase